MDLSHVNSVTFLNPRWESLGGGMYRDTKTGRYKSEKLEAEMPKGFRVIGEIRTNELTGELKKR